MKEEKNEEMRGRSYKFIGIPQDLSSGVCEKGKIRREGYYWLWASRQPVMSSINSITLFYPYLKIVQEISDSNSLYNTGRGGDALLRMYYQCLRRVIGPIGASKL